MVAGIDHVSMLEQKIVLDLGKRTHANEEKKANFIFASISQTRSIIGAV